ncbi:MAG: transposase [Pseudomonadota bacterium]
MPRIARVVAPGMPHHITQRGNRRLQTFFSDQDYATYIDLMKEFCDLHGVEIWSYCLMPNHVHLIAVPETKESLKSAIGEAHRRYSRMINFREGWKGHLWQGRFASYVLDENYLLACARYIEMNPVRANLVKDPIQWQWSSAKSHTYRTKNKLSNIEPLIKLVNKDWAKILSENISPQIRNNLQMHERTGRPLGEIKFIEKLEKRLGMEFKLKKPGRKQKDNSIKTN